MIVAGTVTLKMAPVLKRIWDQMPDPKWCISMGACSSVGLAAGAGGARAGGCRAAAVVARRRCRRRLGVGQEAGGGGTVAGVRGRSLLRRVDGDRKSTRLNSSHLG